MSRVRRRRLKSLIAAMKTEQYRIAAEHRKADMLKLADGFEAAVGEIIETVRSRPLASSMIALTRIWRAWAA